MDDLISRQAAIDEAIEAVDEWDGGCNKERERHITEALNSVPSADAVEVVRCRDCEYGAQNTNGDWYCRDIGCTIGDDDGSGFCSDGERRTDGSD